MPDDDPGAHGAPVDDRTWHSTNSAVHIVPDAAVDEKLALHNALLGAPDLHQ